MTENLFEKIDYDYLNQSLLTVENVQNILYTISPELSKLCYVTFDYPNKDEILNHKYSIINIKQFFNTKNNKNINVFVNIKNNGDGDIYYDDEDYDEDEYGEGLESKNENLNEEDLNKDLEDSNIGHFIIIINNHPTCIILY